MKYIYILDYTFSKIYEAIVPESDIIENMTNIKAYLTRHFNVKESSTHYMISDKKLEIETIEKVK